jgi:thioredoxin
MQAVCGRCGAKLAAETAESQAGHAPAADGKPIVVTDASFARDVLGGALPVLLDCWAEWCGPCSIIAPILDELAAESQGRYRIAKLNADENPQTSAQFGVRSIPTLLIFKHGQLVERIVGVQPKQAIAARLAAHV